MPIRRLHFPVGGLNRRYGYQNQFPFTTPNCLNVRPFDTDEGRERGGSRPGIADAIGPRIVGGGLTGARNLWSVNVVPVEGLEQRYWIEEFSGFYLPSVWTSLIDDVQVGIPVYDMAQCGGHSTLVRDAFPDFAVNKPYTISAEFWPPRGDDPIWGDDWTVYLEVFGGRLDIATDSGIRVTQSFKYYTAPVGVASEERPGSSGWLYHIYIDAYVNDMWVALGYSGTYYDPKAPAIPLRPAVLKFTVMPEETLDGVMPHGVVFLGSNLQIALDNDECYAIPGGCSLGAYAGLRAVAGTHGGYTFPLYVDYWDISYYVSTPSTFEKPSPVLVAAGPDGRIWSNRIPDSMQKVVEPVEDDPPNRLSPDTPKSAAAFLGKLYIADPVNGTFYFDPVANKLFVWGANAAGLTLEEQGQGLQLGEVPQGNHLLARYAGRMVLAGNPEHAWYMSRAGKPHDWDWTYPPGDVGAAVEGILGYWGHLTGPITALIAFSDDYLLFGQRDSIWRLVGDPLAGGRIVNVSEAVGILGPSAWCITPESVCVFMSSDGLFALSPGGMSFPIPISREQLPRELTGIDPLNYRVVLAYDRFDVGIHIWLLHIGGGSESHWWFDWRSKSFWPVQVSSEDIPYDAMWYDGDSRTKPAVILACADGGLRMFSNTATSDSARQFKSYCDYGPVRLANVDSNRGVLNTIRLFKQGSGGPNVDVRIGAYAEDAYRASSVYNGLSNGQVMRVKRGGSVAYIRLSGTGRAWQIENVEVDVAAVGPAKPL